MKLGVKIGTLLVSLLMATTVALPQDQAKKSNEQPASRVRIDFLLTEYNGQQKISSLPYAISMEAGAVRRLGKIRMGVKIPIAQGTDFQYMEIGTGIDCWATALGDGSYDLSLTIDHSSVYTVPPNESEAGSETLHTVSTHPVIQSFNMDFPVRMRDGETQEGTSATDPFNGHVLKISVTLHVVK